MRAKLRFFILLLGIGCSALSLAAQGPEYSGIQSAVLQVSNVEASLKFYRRLFGAEVSRAGQQLRLRLGTGYLQLQQSKTPGIGPVSLAIRDYDPAFVTHYLQMQAIPFQQDRSLKTLTVRDMDGATLILDSVRDWQPDSMESDADPLFRPLAIDELYVSVMNMEVDSLFYSRVLGNAGSLQAGSLWFEAGDSRLRINQTPAGQVAGIGYISILVSNTDLNDAAEAVFAAGGIVETIMPNGFSFWDPDGIRILVRTTDMY